MFSRGYSVAIVLFWLAATGWLVKEKILPPLLVGEPPSYRTILSGQHEAEPIAWEILLNGKSLGAAATRTVRLPDGISQLHCRVSLNELPLSELTPAWITAFVKAMDAGRSYGPAIINVVSDSTIDIDPLNRPLNFSSVTKIGPPADDFDQRSLLAGAEFSVIMKGRIVGDEMQVVMRSGDVEFHTQVDMPADSLMGDVLSPQARLPGLRVGQTWTVPIYSPFRSPNAPIETLHATVERKDPILWHDRIVPALLVVYRSDPGLGLTSNQSARAQMWVDYEGDVIRQEVWLLSSRLSFVRADPASAAFSGIMSDMTRPLRTLPSGIEDVTDPEPPDNPGVSP